MAPLPSKLIVGIQPYLDQAAKGWGSLNKDLKLVLLPITRDASYNFDFSPLSAYQSSSMTAFVAMDDQFLNHKRQELFLHMKQMGFSLPPLVHHQSSVDADVVLQENVWIEQGALIVASVVIGSNSMIGAGSAIHHTCHIGENVTIYENVKMASECKIASNVTIGANVILQPGTEIGVSSRITKPGIYQGIYKEGTFIEDKFSAQIIS